MKVGILGAGQLSQMLALAGIPLGLEFVFLAPQRTNCVKHLGEFIEADYTDKSALEKLAQSVDVVTFENENIPPTSIDLINAHQTCHPSSDVIACMQDRWLEKSLFIECDIPTTTVTQTDDKAAVLDALKHYDYQAVLKKRREGYDGKGQVVIRSQEDAEQLSDAQCEQTILENLIPFEREISIIAARDVDGHIQFYDLNENIHQSGVLHQTKNRINDPMFAKAADYLERALVKFNYVGVCALELFQQGDALIANELAPRVHNTGHWTIEGAVTSQFENHLRAIAGLPLGDTASTGHATMTNILGEMPDISRVLSNPNMHLHDYHKSPRPGRKLGHMTQVSHDER